MCMFACLSSVCGGVCVGGRPALIMPELVSNPGLLSGLYLTPPGYSTDRATADGEPAPLSQKAGNF